MSIYLVDPNCPMYAIYIIGPEMIEYFLNGDAYWWCSKCDQNLGKIKDHICRGSIQEQE